MSRGEGESEADRKFLERKRQTVDDAFSPQINRGKRQRNINKHAVVGVLL